MIQRPDWCRSGSTSGARCNSWTRWPPVVATKAALPSCTSLIVAVHPPAPFGDQNLSDDSGRAEPAMWARWLVSNVRLRTSRRGRARHPCAWSSTCSYGLPVASWTYSFGRPPQRRCPTQPSARLSNGGQVACAASSTSSEHMRAALIASPIRPIVDLLIAATRPSFARGRPGCVGYG